MNKLSKLPIANNSSASTWFVSARQHML